MPSVNPSVGRPWSKAVSLVLVTLTGEGVGRGPQGPSSSSKHAEGFLPRDSEGCRPELELQPCRLLGNPRQVTERL